MCKNLITTKIEKAVILSCQRIVNVHEIDTGTRKDPLGGVLKNELLYSFQLLQPQYKLVTLQAVLIKNECLDRTPSMAAGTLDQAECTELFYIFGFTII